MDHKIIIGSIAALLTLVSYTAYFRDIIVERTRPHVFSWLIWSVSSFIIFFGQMVVGAGAGAWVTGSGGLVSFLVVVLAFRQGEQSITRLDWLSLLGAGIAVGMWPLFDSPLPSLLVAMIVDSFAFMPTFRKSYSKPSEETLITYLLNGTKYLLAFLALDTISILTALYPIYLILVNWSLVVLLVVRRNQLS